MSVGFCAAILLAPTLVVVISPAIAVAPAAAGSRLNGRLLDRDGKVVGSIRQEPVGRYSLFDAQSRRLGYGRESADGRTIEFFAPDGRRLFQLERDRAPRSVRPDPVPGR